MFQKIRNSWALTVQSWGVLRADKHLMVFPLISTLLTVLVSASFLVPAILVAGPMIKDGSTARGGTGGSGGFPLEAQLVWYGLLFVVYFVCSAIVTFCNASLIACAVARFNGEESGAMAGMRKAAARWPQILGWALLNATVGVVLQALKDRAGWIGRWVLSFIGVAWNIASFFVVPALVIEGVGPIAALKRSVEVMKRTWGESLVAQVGVSWVFGLLGLSVVLGSVAGGLWLIIGAQLTWLGVSVICLGVLGAALLALVASTLKMILVAACYRMATTGVVPEGFEGSTLRGMFGQKG